MLNLAGTASSWIRHVFGNELIKAGIPIEENPTSGEVASPIRGVMEFAGGQRIEFSRAWYYVVVNCQKAFPAAEANELNKNWREQIRVEGFAGGQGVPTRGVYGWHVDTLDGLSALTKALLDHYGPCVPQTHPTRLQSNDCVVQTWKMNLHYWKGIFWGATIINPSFNSSRAPVVELDDGTFCLPYTADHARRLVADLRRIIDAREIKVDFWRDVFASTIVADVAVAVKISDFGTSAQIIQCPQARELFIFDFSDSPSIKTEGLVAWKRIKQSMHDDLNEFEKRAFLR